MKVLKIVLLIGIVIVSILLIKLSFIIMNQPNIAFLILGFILMILSIGVPIELAIKKSDKIIKWLNK